MTPYKQLRKAWKTWGKGEANEKQAKRKGRSKRGAFVEQQWAL
jgi:hypothetical protein